LNKKELRDKYLKLRLALSPEELARQSQIICDSFFSLIDLTKIRTIHIFLPIDSKKEPDTWLIIDRLKKEHAHIRVSIPKIDDANRLENLFFKDKQQIAVNKWGIPEPQYGEPTPTKEIDLVMVPMLAFDQAGNRVGYGKGFYDAFLKECRSDCKKIGLSFFEAIENIKDIQPHDERLTHAITPARIYTF